MFFEYRNIKAFCSGRGRVSCLGVFSHRRNVGVWGNVFLTRGVKMGWGGEIPRRDLGAPLPPNILWCPALTPHMLCRRRWYALPPAPLQVVASMPWPWPVRPCFCGPFRTETVSISVSTVQDIPKYQWFLDRNQVILYHLMRPARISRRAIRPACPG